MRKTLFAAVAAIALSSPALARDGSPYIGVEAGVAISDEEFFDVELDDGTTEEEFQSAINVKYELGFDGDLIAGYDFGLIRAEAELAYKSLGVDHVTVRGQLDDLDIDDDSDDSSVLSLMGNALLDFGGENGVGAYVGGGIGGAKVKILGESDSKFAWQFIAGVRMPISSNIDLGLKYRYFNSGNVEFSEDFVDEESDPFSVEVEGKLKTHSLLASLVYNFYTPPPPPAPPPPAPPPPPPAPATQTCPDGSVILATEACPAPPPPPPPPPPAPERG